MMYLITLRPTSNTYGLVIKKKYIYITYINSFKLFVSAIHNNVIKVIISSCEPLMAASTCHY